MSARRWHPARVALALLGVALAVVGGAQIAAPAPAAAAAQYRAPIAGIGSTWSENAIRAWMSEVYSKYDWKIEYTGTGSTQGRQSFALGTADFGVSEIPYAIANSNEADAIPNRKFVYMPIVAGGTAFMYNLRIGGKQVTNLRLSGDVIAKIFTGEITTWNDAAIQADNPALQMPAIPIVPVVRSDGSGATAQFSLWMRQEHPDVWDRYCPKVGRPIINGHCGVTSNYPVVAGSGFVTKAKSNGVAGYVAQSYAVGAITFVEYSYALNARFPVAKMLNNAGYYTEPTDYNVAVALLQAGINTNRDDVNYLTQDLSRVYTDGDSRTYPLSSYSYIILPLENTYNFTDEKGYMLADFGSYFLCEGQQSVGTLGYSPLPVNLVRAGQEQILKIPGQQAKVTGVEGCNNPTLDPGDPNGNALAKKAPLPPDCDRRGPTQCLTGTGGVGDVPTDATGSGGAASDAAADAAGAGGSAATGAGAAGSSNSSRTGADGIAVDAAPVLVQGSPQTLSAAQTGVLPALVLLGAGVGLLAAVLLPPLLGRRRRTDRFPAPARGAPNSHLHD